MLSIGEILKSRYPHGIPRAAKFDDDEDEEIDLDPEDDEEY